MRVVCETHDIACVLRGIGLWRLGGASICICIFARGVNWVGKSVRPCRAKVRATVSVGPDLQTEGQRNGNVTDCEHNGIAYHQQTKKDNAFIPRRQYPRIKLNDPERGVREEGSSITEICKCKCVILPQYCE